MKWYKWIGSEVKKVIYLMVNGPYIDTQKSLYFCCFISFFFILQGMLFFIISNIIRTYDYVFTLLSAIVKHLHLHSTLIYCVAKCKITSHQCTYKILGIFKNMF